MYQKNNGSATTEYNKQKIIVIHKIGILITEKWKALEKKENFILFGSEQKHINGNLFKRYEVETMEVEEKF